MDAAEHAAGRDQERGREDEQADRREELRELRVVVALAHRDGLEIEPRRGERIDIVELRVAKGGDDARVGRALRDLRKPVEAHPELAVHRGAWRREDADDRERLARDEQGLSEIRAANLGECLGPRGDLVCAALRPASALEANLRVHGEGHGVEAAHEDGRRVVGGGGRGGARFSCERDRKRDMDLAGNRGFARESRESVDLRSERRGGGRRNLAALHALFAARAENERVRRESGRAERLLHAARERDRREDEERHHRAAGDHERESLR